MPARGPRTLDEHEGTLIDKMPARRPSVLDNWVLRFYACGEAWCPRREGSCSGQRLRGGLVSSTSGRSRYTE